MSEALNSSAEVAVQATNVRAELKVWEKSFAAANGGKKAGRDDIKQNAEIGTSNAMTLIANRLIETLFAFQRPNTRNIAVSRL